MLPLSGVISLPWGHLSMFGNMFSYYNWKQRASAGGGAVSILNVQDSIAFPKNYPTQMSTVLGFRQPAQFLQILSPH